MREAELKYIAQLKRQKEVSKSIRQGTPEAPAQARSPVKIEGIQSGEVKAHVRASERRAAGDSPV